MRKRRGRRRDESPHIRSDTTFNINNIIITNEPPPFTFPGVTDDMLWKERKSNLSVTTIHDPSRSELVYRKVRVSAVGMSLFCTAFILSIRIYTYIT